MTGTTTGIVVVCVVIVVSLAIWLALVAHAARRPGQEHPKREPLRGLVQGGQHVGGGRSVAPTRDAPCPREEATGRRSKKKTGPRRPGLSRPGGPGTQAVRWTCDQPPSRPLSGGGALHR
jgi:hypothetical protein